MNTCIRLLIPLRKLEEIIAKLEPLSKPDSLLKFLRNVDNARTLMGFIQDLANAITDYQVGFVSPSMIFTEQPTRSQYKMGWMKGQGASVIMPTMSGTNTRVSGINAGISVKLRTSLTNPRTSTPDPRMPLVALGTSLVTPGTFW